MASLSELFPPQIRSSNEVKEDCISCTWILQICQQSSLAKEERLDVIWHNAGIMVPPDGRKTKQGFDLQVGTNPLGPFLFQHFLTPLCLKTVSRPDVKPFGTRVIFVSSSGHRVAPKPDGVNWDDINMEFKARGLKYGQSKALVNLVAIAFGFTVYNSKLEFAHES